MIIPEGRCVESKLHLLVKAVLLQELLLPTLSLFLIGIKKDVVPRMPCMKDSGIFPKSLPKNAVFKGRIGKAEGRELSRPLRRLRPGHIGVVVGKVKAFDAQRAVPGFDDHLSLLHRERIEFIS